MGFRDFFFLKMKRKGKRKLEIYILNYSMKSWSEIKSRGEVLVSFFASVAINLQIKESLIFKVFDLFLQRLNSSFNPKTSK